MKKKTKQKCVKQISLIPDVSQESHKYNMKNTQTVSKIIKNLKRKLHLKNFLLLLLPKGLKIKLTKLISLGFSTFSEINFDLLIFKPFGKDFKGK